MRTFVLLVLLAQPAIAAAQSQAYPPSKLTQQADASLQKATEFLLSQIDDEGMIKSDYGPDYSKGFYGGKTALAAYALLAADISPETPELQRAIRWLLSAKLKSTYAIALRCCAMAEWNQPHAWKVMKHDVSWLLRADKNGAYSYKSKHKHDDGRYDNSNTQIALLGVWAAAQCGIEVPKSYWLRLEEHWLNEQQPDGGWGYFKVPLPEKTRTYGFMTAAGVASLFICFDRLHQGRYARTTSQSQYKPLAAGLGWLEKNFVAGKNPKKGRQYYYYWLYSLERVGLTSGYKYFGEHNWYDESLKELLKAQNDDGSWGHSRRVSDTAFAVLFLARGRSAILLNKLRYTGRWNTRPRDAINLTRWLGRSFERPLSWQVISLDAPVQDWHDAPILYLSGAGVCPLESWQIDKLRQFVLQGGLIVSEAAGNNGDFTLDMQQTYRQMFPQLPLQHLPDDHPIYNFHYQPQEPRGLMGISNGLRLLVLHAPKELSLALQLGATKKNRPWFELWANIYLLATDKGLLPPRGTSHWPKKQVILPKERIAVARLKHAGNCDPEPLAWKRLAILMGNRHQIDLEVSEPLEILLLDAKLHPVAVMTGTEGFTLTPAEQGALKKYFQDGGTLFVDAAGRSRSFDESFRKQILILPEHAVETALPVDHPIYQGPDKIPTPIYRRDFAVVLGAQRHQARLRGVMSDGRLAILYSREDLTAGLVGYQASGLRGYTPQAAVALMSNALLYTTRLAPSPASQPTTEPAPP